MPWLYTLIYVCMTPCTLPICNISVGLLMLPAPEAGDYVELILFYSHFHVADRICMHNAPKETRFPHNKRQSYQNGVKAKYHSNCNTTKQLITSLQICLQTALFNRNDRTQCWACYCQNGLRIIWKTNVHGYNVKISLACPPGACIVYFVRKN